MALKYDHDELVKDLALLIERDSRYALVKYFVPWGDAKTDLIGPFYPDITVLRREGRIKVMIEFETPYSFEDSDEVRRLESLSSYCAANGWEFHIACADDETRELTKKKIYGREVQPKAIWVLGGTPFAADKPIDAVA
ncbi:MAG TPA: hypothetical protein VI895_09130 [Bdellovibrionota bacterium]|nr:hypothetical protein [Bdellovibrionota bacterium]